VYGGTFRFVTSQMQRFDHHFNTSVFSRAWAPITFNNIVRWDMRENGVVPDLAATWELSDSEAVFHLVQGVKFQDVAPVNGREFTAEDVKFNLDRMRTEPASVFKNRYRFITDVVVVDPYTVKFLTSQADSNLLTHLAYEQTVMFAQESAIDGFFDDPAAQIGTGPFTADLLQSVGQNRMERNPNYFRKSADGMQLPYLDRIELLGTRDVAVTAALMKTKQVDWIITSNKPDVEFLLAQPGIQKKSTYMIMIGTTGYPMNTTIPPFDNINLRKAFNLLIDRQTVIELANQGYAYVTGPIGVREDMGHWGQEKIESMPGLRPNKPQEDVDEARRLMDEAGFGDGFSFEMQFGFGSLTGASADAVLLIQEQLEALDFGIEITLDSDGDSSYELTTHAVDHQVIYSTEGSGVAPDYSLTNVYHSNALKNSANYFDPKLDAMIDAQVAMLDFEVRKTALLEIQDYLWDVMVLAPGVRGYGYHFAWPRARNWAGPDYVVASRTSMLDEVWIVED